MKAGAAIAGEVGDQMKKGWDVMKKKGLPFLSRIAQDTKSKVVSMAGNVTQKLAKEESESGSEESESEEEKPKQELKKKGKKSLQSLKKEEKKPVKEEKESEEEKEEESAEEDEVAYL